MLISGYAVPHLCIMHVTYSFFQPCPITPLCYKSYDTDKISLYVTSLTTLIKSLYTWTFSKLMYTLVYIFMTEFTLWSNLVWYYSMIMFSHSLAAWIGVIVGFPMVFSLKVFVKYLSSVLLKYVVLVEEQCFGYHILDTIRCVAIA